MISPKKKAGRPRYVATAAMRLKVRCLRADGKEQAEIASALEISIDTLQRYYPEELKSGDLSIRAEILAKQAAKALKGDTPAARLFISMTGRGEAQRAAKAAQEEFTGEAASAPKKKLGKKEQALEDATDTVSGGTPDWGDDLNPQAPGTLQ